MPIHYQIDHDRRLVLARGEGKLTDQDVFGYQLEVWSRPDVGGYGELIDMSDVVQIVVPSAARMKELAQLAAGMDVPGSSSKFAIVASDELARQLGYMFKVYRQLDSRSTKSVSLFQSMADALHWLEVGAPAPNPIQDLAGSSEEP
jgi:hypothetical protein